GRQIIDRARILGIAHVDDAKALGEHMPDIGMAAMHHNLHPVGAAALVAPANQAHVAGIIGSRQVVAHRYAAKKFGTAIQSIMASWSCSSFHILRSSSVLRSTPRWAPIFRPCSMMRSPIGWRSAL